MAQWLAAAGPLDAQRRADLRSLTAAQALKASEALLDLAATCALAPHRQTHSGLVEQQALFDRLRAR